MEHEFGLMIRRARLKKGWSIDKFIKAMGISFSAAYITKIETKGEIPNPSRIILIAELLELDESILLDLALKEKIKKFQEDLTRKYLIALELSRESKQSPKAL